MIKFINFALRLEGFVQSALAFKMLSIHILKNRFCDLFVSVASLLLDARALP